MTDVPKGPNMSPEGDAEDRFDPLAPTGRSLAFLYGRLGSNSRQMASVLHRYRDHQGWDDARLADHLGLTIDGLHRLGLSGIPRDAQFGIDIQDIARRHNVPDLTLMRLVRAVQTWDTFVASPATGRMLAAARDHDGEQLAPASLVSEDPATYDEAPPDAASPDDAPDTAGPSDDPPGTNAPGDRRPR